MFAQSWTASDVAEALCDALSSAGKLPPSGRPARDNREAKIAEVFKCVGSPPLPASAASARQAASKLLSGCPHCLYTAGSMNGTGRPVIIQPDYPARYWA